MNLGKFKRRAYITGFLILSAACFFIFTLFGLHFSDLIIISNKRNPVVKRGYIRDRNGYLLALSIERNSLFANPEEIENHEEIEQKLAPLIGESTGFIRSRIIRKKKFVWLRRKLDDETVERIKKMQLKGLHFKKEFKREYPHGHLASNILGFVGVDNRGLEGIEYKYNDVLTGGPERSLSDTKIVRGHNISLTIDRFIQHVAEQALAEGVIAVNAEQGAAVVMEVKTGRILAIAKYPSFNPDSYYRASSFTRRNFTIVDAFEPGSTLKILAMATILEQVPESQRSQYHCTGEIKIYDEVIKCTRTHGELTLDEIIKYSCNVGIITAMKPVNRKAFYALLHRFGFGRKTGIELPGEIDGILRPVSAWSGLSKYSIAIGHEISVNSVQMVAAFGAIANGGIYQVPSILESIERGDGSIVQSFYPRTKGRILSRAIAMRLLKMMHGVVLGGTGTKAALRYYTAAGKTGTSQKPMKRGGYYPDKFTASFIGIAPLENPDICILVVVDEPKGVNTGGEVAAPIFSQIAQRILPYRGVKKTIVPITAPRRMRFPVNITKGIVPDFKGLLLSEALHVLIEMQKRNRIDYVIVGEGRVFAQSPPENTRISGSQKIVLYLRE